MDYGVVGKSAVPHVTSLGQHFQIDYEKYQFSLIVQCSFIILVVPLFGIWIYFSSKYKNPKKKKQGEQEDPLNQNKQQSGDNKKSASFNAEDVDARSQFIPEDQCRQSRTSSYHRRAMQDQYTLEGAAKINDQQMKKKLQIAERKICYGVCFFILQVVTVNRFDCGILSIVSFYLILAFYLIFNIIRPKKHPILLGLYIVASFLSAISCWIGNHTIGIHLK